MVLYVLNIESGSALDQQPNDSHVTSQRGLVQRCRVRVASHGVVPAWVLAGVEKQTDDLGMPMLCRQRERAMSMPPVGAWKHLARIFNATGRSGGGQVDLRSAADQRVHGVEFAMSKRRPHGAIGIGSLVAQEIDEWNLHATLAWYPARAHKPECRVDATFIRCCARVENHSSHLDDVWRQVVVAHGILGDELKERRIPEVVTPFEHDALTD